KYQAIVLLSLAIVIILFLVYSISRSISIPVREMTSQIKDLAQGEGNIGFRFPELYQNEFGEQSLYFNEFLEKLSSIVKKLISVATELSATIGNVTGSSEKLALVAQDQAAGLEESSAALEELSGSINSVSKSVSLENENILSINRNTSDLNSSIQGVNASLKKLSSVAENSAVSAEDGRAKIKLATEAMEEITRTASEINNIVSIITDISDQTNLLSLNAAIEAARAGEFGKGFAVVAQEVSKLADRTVSSVKEINTLIGKSYKAIASGTHYIEETISVFQDNIRNINEISGFISNIVTDMNAQEKNTKTISANVGKIVDLSSQVYTATEEQLSASDLINEMVQKLSVGTQSVADNAQSMVDVASELENASSNIENVLIKFKL
ncbi:MAG: hypothetical protein K8R21_07860, partial [Leptospira sp.]|nr:hypothetical protein [Leptospira sp.]